MRLDHGPNCFDPSSPPSSKSYNWTNNLKNDNWMIGVGVDVPVGDRFLLTGSVIYDKVDGSSDMTAQQNFGNPLPLTQYPNIKMWSLNVKGTYRFNKNWSVTGGYAYQKYDYNDEQFIGYKNTIPIPGVTNNTSQSYLNNWNAFQTYNANIFYLLANFKFDPPQLPAPVMRVAEAAPAPVARPAPPPPPPPPSPAPAPAPQVQKMTLDSRVLFDFDKAVLKPEGKTAIDSQIVGKLTQIQKLEVVLVTGHTDRLGTVAHNQALSLRRADAVRDYLVSKGVPRDKIETIGMGEKQPLPGVQCDQKNVKELIACLQPNRRVEVEVKGESMK
jgi:outer membrane protein OmpA-like peptidoglycan-associated protein